MHRFFSEDGASIRGEELKHLRQVLRLAPGDEIEVLWDGRRLLAELTEVAAQAAAFAVRQELPDREPRCRVTLYQGLCKGEKMDFLVQKCTEMGVHAVVPVEMARSVARADHAQKKTERLARIAREAVKQCGRAHVPEVLLMPYEEGGQPFAERIAARSVGLLIGPEGGIAPEEAEAVRAIGGQAMTLGSRILRTETAGLVALTLTLHGAGDLGGE